VTVAALILAVALMVAPGQPRRRLGPARSPQRSRRGAVLAGCLAAVATSAVLAPVTATAAAVVALGLITLRRRDSRARTRRTEEAAALQGALGVLVGELRVGAHPVVAFENAAAEVEGQVADSLRAVAARARLGADVAAGLRSIAVQSTVPQYWERLSATWLLAQSHGLAIVALIRAAERDIVERERFASGVTAGMAGARATATILAGLPVLGVGLGHAIGAEPLRFLLSGGVGGWCLLIGVTLACAGLWWSDRITDRVLG
jgi:tight adherence protein B